MASRGRSTTTSDRGRGNRDRGRGRRSGPRDFTDRAPDRGRGRGRRGRIAGERAERSFRAETDYIPTVYRLTTNTESFAAHVANPDEITDAELVSFSSAIDFACLRYGFNNYYHAGKNKMIKIVADLTDRARVYDIFDKFDISANVMGDFDETESKTGDKTLMNHMRLRFNIESTLTSEFFHLREMLMYFDLMPETAAFKSLHIDDHTHSHQMATQMYCDDHGVQGVYDSLSVIADAIDVSTRHAEYDFITSDIMTTRIAFPESPTQEQEAFREILNSVLVAVSSQNRHGTYVCRCVETYSRTTMKLIAILCDLYDDVLLVKPLTSNEALSDKYIVCMAFKGLQKTTHKYIARLFAAVNANPMNVINIVNDYHAPRDVEICVSAANTRLSNLQFKAINDMIAFVNGNMYSGEEYYARRTQQSYASGFWADVFTDSRDKTHTKSMAAQAISIAKRHVEVLSSKLVSNDVF